MAKLIALDGTITTVTPAGRCFTLQELYRYVETDIVEAVPLRSREVMWVDEEGKLRQPLKPVKAEATRYAHVRGLPLDDYIVGPALVTGPSEVD